MNNIHARCQMVPRRNMVPDQQIKPWFRYYMDWTFSKLWLLNIIDDKFMFATPNSKQISAFEPNCREPLLYHGQRMCSLFFILLLSCRTERILALSLPPEPLLILLESYHLLTPLDFSFCAMCPTLPFIRLLPHRRDLVSLMK